MNMGGAEKRSPQPFGDKKRPLVAWPSDTADLTWI
jgi:hypothetical protein